MIKGIARTEATYRDKALDSSSSLKDFSMDRKKYFRKYIMGETIEEKENLAANMGRIVETLLLEPDQFDGRFYMSSANSAPTGLMLDFIEALYKLTKEATDEKGNVTRDFDDISREAYGIAGYKLTYEAVIKTFVSPNKAGDIPQHYYEEIRKVRTNNLTVITPQEVSIAERIVENLRNNDVTRDIVNLVDSPRYSVLNQFQVEGYEINGLELKSMLDKVIVDHDLQLIKPIDLKCTWTVENFYEEYYLYRRAYIQAGLYWKAISSLTEKGGKYEGYVVENLKFLVCDSTNYMNPLIYTLTDDDMSDAFNGFEHKRRKYPGIYEIVGNLKWALDTNIWNISREHYLAGGIINIKD